MTVQLDDYREELVAAAHELADTLDATFHEAARTLSPAGLKDYLEGARGLVNLGKGPQLLTTYLEEMPLVARECGEDVIRDGVHAVMKLASMTSGEVLTLVFATLPTAARRLGDPELLRAYLQLLHRLAAKAPRGLRPMLNQLDELLGKLTLSGLRRWADFGAEAYRRDLPRQAAYFGLETEDSKAVLQQERRGTLFIDSQRKLNLYLRAFWGRPFLLRPAAADSPGFRPFIEARSLHLPDAVDAIGAQAPASHPSPTAAADPLAVVWERRPRREADAGRSRRGAAPTSAFVPRRSSQRRLDARATDSGGKRGLSGLDLYRAMCAHMAAHLVYTTEPQSAEALTPAQRFCVGLVEDARVEYRAIQAFPGMGRLWRDCMTAPKSGSVEHPSLPLIERIALALLDPETRTGDAALDAIGARFHDGIAAHTADGRFARHIGLDLCTLLAQRQAMPSLRILEQLRIPYRDDNRFIWSLERHDGSESTAYLPASQRQVRRRAGLMEFVNTLDVETAGDDAQEIWVLGSELFPYEDGGVSYNEREGREPVSDPFHYPEWDYQVQLHRPNWATVYERRQGRADPQLIDALLTAHKGVSHRIEQIIDRLRPQGVSRQRKLEDGDELDINAVVDAMVAVRMGRHPDTRVTLRHVLKRRDLAVVILLDLSESTNEKVRGSDKTVLELTREACSLVATAITGIGDPYAIHGFASDGRHDVHYYRFKDFDQRFDAEVKSRLAGMSGGLSTRMGAAMRHAGHHLQQRGERHKLLLLVTDGEPADIDERDPQYLRRDAKKAAEELRTRGVLSYCLTLDPQADRYVERIFGANHYTIVDHVQRLPEKLPALFASLTR